MGGYVIWSTLLAVVVLALGGCGADGRYVPVGEKAPTWVLDTRTGRICSGIPTLATESDVPSCTGKIAIARPVTTEADPERPAERLRRQLYPPPPPPPPRTTK